MVNLSASYSTIDLLISVSAALQIHTKYLSSEIWYGFQILSRIHAVSSSKPISNCVYCLLFQFCLLFSVPKSFCCFQCPNPVVVFRHNKIPHCWGKFFPVRVKRRSTYPISCGDNLTFCYVRLSVITCLIC